MISYLKFDSNCSHHIHANIILDGNKEKKVCAQVYAELIEKKTKVNLPAIGFNFLIWNLEPESLLEFYLLIEHLVTLR